MIILDTCSLIYWTLEPTKLTKNAEKAVEVLERDGGFISSISLWEIGIKIKEGKLDICMSISDFANYLTSTNLIEVLSVDWDIWLRSLNLNWNHHDPADRVIVATAQSKKLQLMTSDIKIREFYKNSIW